MPAPIKQLIAVDLVIQREDGLILMIERGNDPFKGMLALPGGFVEPNETLERAALRELQEETKVRLDKRYLKLIGGYSDPERDPRGRVISMAYYARVLSVIEAEADDDAAEVHWLSPDYLKDQEIAFDHHKILADAKRFFKKGRNGRHH